jgi:hypothetical protein
MTGESGAVDISSSSIVEEFKTWRYTAEEESSDCDMSKMASIVEAK